MSSENPLEGPTELESLWKDLFPDKSPEEVTAEQVRERIRELKIFVSARLKFILDKNKTETAQKVNDVLRAKAASTWTTKRLDPHDLQEMINSLQVLTKIVFPFRDFGSINIGDLRDEIRERALSIDANLHGHVFSSDNFLDTTVEETIQILSNSIRRKEERLHRKQEVHTQPELTKSEQKPILQKRSDFPD